MQDLRYIFRKKPESICQFVYCLKPWTKHIRGVAEGTWVIRLCDDHAKRYEGGIYRPQTCVAMPCIVTEKNAA